MTAVNRYLKDTAKVIEFNQRIGALESKVASLNTVTTTYNGYIYLNEFRQAGETDDNLALQRAKIIQLSTGFPIYLAPGKGSGTTLDDGIDKFTNQVIHTRFRAQAGDYLIDSWSQASDTSSGTTNTSVTNNTLPNYNDSGNMWSNMVLLGLRGQSRIRRANKNKPYIFTCNPVNTPATTSATGEDEQSHVYKDIIFSGITFVSNVQFDGLSEYQAQVQVNAVDNFYLDNCESLGHRGDAFQIGNGHVSGGQQNRHNRFVIIRNTYINGANQNNRNPVTVNDCDYLLLDNVQTVQCGKFGRAFGTTTPQQDFNPNSGLSIASSLVTFQQNALVSTSILRNVTVRDSGAVDGGGYGVVLILNYNGAATLNPVQNITIKDSNFRRVKSGIFSTGATYNSSNTYADQEYSVRFINNKVASCVFPFDVSSMNGLEIDNNLFTDCSRNGVIGLDGSVNNLAMTTNTFRRTGVVNYGAFIVSGCTGKIAYNRFVDCPTTDFSFKGFGTTKDLTIDQNEVINTLGTTPSMVVTMQVFDTYSGGQYVKYDLRGESVHVSYHPSNTLPPYYGIPATPSSPLLCNGARAVAFPKNTSAWKNGTKLSTAPDLPRGEIETLRKSGTFTGPSPADRWTPTFQDGGIPIQTTTLGNSYIGPIANASTGAPAGVAIDDNRLLATMNSESFWKSTNQGPFVSSLGYNWATVRVAAPSILTNGVMVGLTHYTDYPESWIANKNSFGVIKFGVLFENGALRLIVGGALGGYVTPSLIKAILGSELVFLNAVVSIVYNVSNGEGRILITHPETKSEIQVVSAAGSSTGQSIYPMARFTNANEFVRIYS